MKKSILIMVLLLITFTISEAKEQTVFIHETQSIIKDGRRSGRLSKREVAVLKRELKQYKRTLHNFQENGKLSRKERKKLNKLENAIDQHVFVALNNKETMRGAKRDKYHKTKSKYRRGYYNNGPVCRTPTNRGRRTN